MENQEVEEAQQTTGLFLLRNKLLDLLFPPTCLHCGRVDSLFCDACQRILKDLPNEPVFVDLPIFTATLATGKHEGILQEAVQALKYYQALSIAPLLAERMLKALAAGSWTFDIISPVPISSHRLKERGYNQAKEISYYLARQLNIPHQPTALQKIRHTQSQVGLSHTERLSNLKGAFSADSSVLKGKTLLLVDDVRSTGATLLECAKSVMEAGASAVYAITVTTAL